MIHLFLAQQNYQIGQFDYNTQKIIDAIRLAREKGGDLIVFPELALCGYPPQDLLLFPEFLEQSMSCLDEIAKEANGIAVLVGGPGKNPHAKGKAFYNTAYFLEDGQIKAQVNKSLLPDYDIFDECRHFEPGFPSPLIPLKGYQLGITICEDIWDLGPRSLYQDSPLAHLKEKGAQLLINISASPFDYEQPEKRQRLLRDQCRVHGLDLVYVNAVGAQTELIFDGASQIVSAKGQALLVLPSFEESLQSYVWEPSKDSWPKESSKSVQQSPAQRTLDPEEGMAEIHQALILGIRDYFSKMGFTRALVASSGGVDSALTQALATEALGPQQVVAVSMPSPYTSASSVDDARQLSQLLGNPFEVLNIENLFRQFKDTLSPIFGHLPEDVTEENLQSRIRGTIAMALANKFGYILLNTSNKSELATGYGTLYGDMAGGLSVIGDLYKVQVYALSRYLNSLSLRIPESILTKPPSAELHPGQLDLDSLPDYGLLDPLLFQFIEAQQGPQALIKQGFDPELVQRILPMVHKNEYKRAQFCPILRVSTKAFGKGRQIPMVGKLPW